MTTDGGCCHCFPIAIPIRYSIVLLACFGFFILNFKRFSFPIALISMTNNVADVYVNPYDENLLMREYLDEVQTDQFLWSSGSRGLIVSAHSCGLFLTTLPGGRLAELFGGRHVMSAGMLVSSGFHILIPVMAPIGWLPVTILRLLQGFAEGLAEPAVQQLVAVWVPPKERELVMALLSLGRNLGQVAAFPLSGYLSSWISIGGWRSVFYVCFIISIVWYLAWQYFTAESPMNHPRITQTEREFLVTSLNINISQPESNIPVPWREILTSKPFWAVIIASFCNGWMAVLTSIHFPGYLTFILHYSVLQTGIMMAAVPLSWSLSGLVCSQIVRCMDKLDVETTTRTRKIFQCLAGVGPAVCLLGAVLSTSIIGDTVLMLLAAIFCGAAVAGHVTNIAELSLLFAGTVRGLCQATSLIPGWILPFLTALETKQDPELVWNLVFVLTAGILMATTAAYLLLASAEQQRWGETSEGKNSDFDIK